MKGVIETIFLVGLAVAAIGIPSVVVWQVISAEGKADSCYIREYPNVTDGKSMALIGHVEWREDPIIGWFATQDDARTEAAKINCIITP